ncbi:hypothetical protein GW17_00006939 [Ensete ventricosum]|nr:hypothetical protein GW17_00006939 [Ensete ventricosum]
MGSDTVGGGDLFSGGFSAGVGKGEREMLKMGCGDGRIDGCRVTRDDVGLTGGRGRVPARTRVWTALKFTAKSLQRQARKCEKEEKSEKLKVKKAIEKGNMDGARIYAQNAIRKRTEQMNYLRLSSRLDAVVARLDTQAKMQVIGKSMGSIVKSLDAALATGNLQKMSETMDQFERQFVNMEVQAEFMEGAMAGSTSLSTPETEVNSLMQQVADDYGLEVSVGLPQPAAHVISAKDNEKVDEDDLSRRLAELKARG